SPTPLAPVADLGLRVAFRNERTQAEYEVPVALSSSQLAAREALITAVPPRQPRRVGAWTVTWRVGTRELARQKVEGIPAKWFAVADKSGVVKPVRQIPAGDLARIGPCFLVASSEPGMAGACVLQVCAQV